MTERVCPVCFNIATIRLRKKNTDYWQCESCRMLFSEPIDQEGLVGGQHEIGRNELQNHIRLDRVATMTKGMNKEDVQILDFGAGHGLLVADLKSAGYQATPFDAYNPEFSRLPEKNKYHLCIMVEVIEHLSPSYIELDLINRSLVDGGLLYLETGFINICNEDGIDISDYLYVAPEAGHATIFSHHALDLLMFQKNFRPRRHFDRNCRLFEKVKK